MQPTKKKRASLNYRKCLYCRNAKKKCEPIDRKWPGKKCNRCDELSLPCSDNHRAGEAFRQSISVSTSLTSSSFEDLERLYISWTRLMYMTSQHVHLVRSVNTLRKRLQVIPDGRGHITFIDTFAERMKLKSERWLEKLRQCSIFLRQLLVRCPGLLRNVDMCMSYLSFLLQISNRFPEADNMMFSAVRFLTAQVEQCNGNVTGDYGFALLVQEIIILQTLGQDNTSTLSSLLLGYFNSHRNLRQLDGETDALPPIHQLILLTRSNEILQAASNSGILPHVMSERDIFGRGVLELVLDEVPYPNLQSFLGIHLGPNVKTDLFGRTRLHVACMNGYEDIAQWYLYNGDDPNARGPNGVRPLHIAICYGFESLAFSLIRWEELDISCTDDLGMTCLQYAQRNNFGTLSRHLRLQADSQRKNISYYRSFELSG